MDSKRCRSCDDKAKRLKELETKNKELETKNKNIESRLQYYENPHSPPSSNSLLWKKQKKSKRSNNPTTSKPGQKPGHKGVTHNFKPTQTIHHKSDACSKCGSKKIIQTKQTTRIIVEIPKPQPVTVTKHVIPSYMCNDCNTAHTAQCNLPKKGCLGFNLIGAIVSLWSARIPVRNISKMISVFNSVNLSAGTINNCLNNTAIALEPLVNEIKHDICTSETAHFDEIKYPINGKTAWVWGGVNLNSCFITAEKSRGANVLEKHFSSFKGVAVCDGWKPYRVFEKIQRCWAHILRDVKYASERLETENSESLYRKLGELYDDIKYEQPSKAAHDDAMSRFERIVSEHSHEEELEKIINKLDNAKDNLFTFLIYDGVEPTNNRAERSLRESVVNRKIRGCFRNQKGMDMFGNLMSCMMTWNIRGCNPLDEIVKYV